MYPTVLSDPWKSCPKPQKKKKEKRKIPNLDKQYEDHTAYLSVKNDLTIL